jgi:hypothetical protein
MHWIYLFAFSVRISNRTLTVNKFLGSIFLPDYNSISQAWKLAPTFFPRTVLREYGS